MKCERYAVGSSAAGGGVFANLPTFRLVGKLESWRGVAGEMASAGGGWRWSGWTVAGQEAVLQGGGRSAAAGWRGCDEPERYSGGRRREAVGTVLQGKRCCREGVGRLAALGLPAG